MDRIEKIAKVAHDINRAYCLAIGDNLKPVWKWEDAPQWQKDSYISGVIYRIDHPNTTPKEMHDEWLKHKKENGWKYGPKKNQKTKEHPCIVPYEKLPTEQKTKDFLFSQVVESLKDLI